MKKRLINFSLSILCISIIQSCSNISRLEECWNKQVKPIQEKLIEISFEEELNELRHNFEPWKQTKYSIKGTLWVNGNKFLKLDTLTNSRGQKYFSKTDYSNGILMYLDYGEKNLTSITKDIMLEKIIKSARYSPIPLIDYFMNNQSIVSEQVNQKHTIYSLNIDGKLIKVLIDNTSYLVSKITYLSHDELYGDVLSTYSYSNHKNTNNLVSYASTIDIEKINGNIIEKVNLTTFKISPNEKVQLLDKPEGYKILESIDEKKPFLSVIKYNDFIHFIELQHTDDRVMVVEFDEFLLVAEAPLNSENGELIIAEARKIAPSKPIKYFVFGHHHPHYLGGLRAFVHKEATIICTEISEKYIEYIANAPHTLEPDSLQLESRPLKTIIVKDKLSIGKNEKMLIYFIGEKSKHTKDYLIYYFPSQRLLFQDDLCWIASKGEIGKARDRQVGLYNVIKELNINVDTIIQSWPVKDYGVKTIIPFQDLETSMNRK